MVNLICSFTPFIKMGQVFEAAGPMTINACDHALDLKGLKCPLPVMKTRKALARLTAGQILKVEATDPLSEIDIPHFIASEGHKLLTQLREGQTFIFWIKAKG
jgi:tRNA 2-thiouridine synthesizing protein A